MKRRSITQLFIALLCLGIQLRHTAGTPQFPGNILTEKDQSEMVLVPAGSFVYGITLQERKKLLKQLNTADLEVFKTESPRETKSTDAFYIDKYEVTNGQYEKFLRETGYSRKPQFSKDRLFRDSQQPVVGIGWEDARSYARWAGKRLPSEEEWEKAARGTDGRIWPWGNTVTGKEYNGKQQGRYAPARVGSFPEGKSPYGAMDMAGNVYEMTTGIWNGTERAMRGGSFLNSAAYTMTVFRWAPDDSVNGASWLGFRCVLDARSMGTLKTRILKN